MFIKTESEGLYRQYVEQSINSAYSDRSKELKTRAEVIQGDQDFQTEDVFENPKDTVAYHKAKTAAGKYVNFLIENTSAHKVFYPYKIRTIAFHIIW